MKTIVTPTDFSPISLNAVNYAADLAVNINASLSLIYICPLPMSFSEVPYPPQTLDVMMQDAEKSMQQLKSDINKLKDGKLKIYTEVRIGIVLPEIKAYCKTIRPHVVVMGTQGVGAIERLIFGSTTLSAIKSLSCPLIIVPPDRKFTAIKKIGLACDLKNVVKTFPIHQIKSLMHEFKAELHVIHVNLESDEKFNEEVIEQSEDLQNMLQDLHPSYHFLNNTDVEEGLTDFAERNELDLLIVVPKNHNIIGNILHRSHSKQLALHSPVPIMAVHE